LRVVVFVNTLGSGPERLAHDLAATVVGQPLRGTGLRPFVATALPAAVRDAAVGRYLLQLGPRVLPLELRPEGAGLVSQAEGQGSFPLVYLGDDIFGAEFDRSMRLTLRRDGWARDRRDAPAGRRHRARSARSLTRRTGRARDTARRIPGSGGPCRVGERVTRPVSWSTSRSRMHSSRRRSRSPSRILRRRAWAQRAPGTPGDEPQRAADDEHDQERVEHVGLRRRAR
jgi:hypothetical protein